MKMAEKLKPCPFCGRNAYLDGEIIYCDCGAKMEISAYADYAYGEKVNGFPTYDEARKKMITSWNRRTEND